MNNQEKLKSLNSSLEYKNSDLINELRISTKMDLISWKRNGREGRYEYVSSMVNGLVYILDYYLDTTLSYPYRISIWQTGKRDVLYAYRMKSLDFLKQFMDLIEDRILANDIESRIIELESDIQILYKALEFLKETNKL